MMIAIACPGCGKAGEVPESFAGRQIKCRVCGTRFPVPGQADDAWLPPGLDTPAPNPNPTTTTTSATPAASTPSAPVQEPASSQTKPAPKPRRAALASTQPSPSPPQQKRVPNVFRAFLFFLFKLVVAALLVGYPLAVVALPMLREDNMLYLGLGGFAVVTLVYLVLVRVFYRSVPGAFPDRPR